MPDYVCRVKGCGVSVTGEHRIVIGDEKWTFSTPCCSEHIDIDTGGPLCVHRVPLTIHCSLCEWDGWEDV